jgi:hypothetical protein
MGGYVTLPPSLIGSDEEARWVREALDHVAALPPKAPKTAKR